jgi:integrase
MALTDTFVKNAKPGVKPNGDKYSDGGGLYLHVKTAGKYWRLAYAFAGRQKTLALGVYPYVSLLQARKRRDAARKLLADDADPGQAKKDAKQAKLAELANTFERVATAWLADTAADRKPDTQSKVTNWLLRDVYPSLGSKPISAITPRDVLATIRLIEARGAVDSAHRIKQLIGQIMRYAVSTGAAERDATQDLKGALKVATKGHHAAITEPKQAGALLRAIYSHQGQLTTMVALKLAPLVFVRPGELRHAEWAEIDLEAALWRIPGSKMKMKVDHLVPLCTQAVELLRSLQPTTGHGRYVFPSLRTGQTPMSENTINAALRGMGYAQNVHTGHGFRAMARTILDEVLGERVDLIEHQLAHTVKDPLGRAYNRTAHLPARTDMMQRWADYLDKLRVGGEVIAFKTV